MAQVSLPYTLQAGQPENVNQLVANLDALVAGVNTVDTAQIANGAVTFAKIANAGWQSAYSATQQTGTNGADFTYTSAEIELSAGNWIILAGASITVTNVLDSVGVGVWNQTSNAAVANSYGAGGTVTTLDYYLPCVSAPVKVSPSSATKYRPRIARNGGSTPKVDTVVSGIPAAWIAALQIP